jgi:hypothetical protein
MTNEGIGFLCAFAGMTKYGFEMWFIACGGMTNDGIGFLCAFAGMTNDGIAAPFNICNFAFCKTDYEQTNTTSGFRV